MSADHGAQLPVTTTPRWAIERADDGVHVVPIGDLIGHDLTDACACGTRTDPVARNDGSIGWVIVHNSLDGREATE